MKLILLYGAPATGKYTIATELSKKTGFPLLHNHVILNALSDIFGFDHPARKKLEKEFRMRIIEEAVAANVNLIVTGVIMKDNEAFYQKFLQMVDNAGGEIKLIHLMASHEELQSRIANDSRKALKKLNSQEKLNDWLKKYPESMNKLKLSEHMTIDTTNISPDEAAEQILNIL